VLCQDETVIRLFPVLRRSWSVRGQQALVRITGRNAQRVLSCALNLRTGRRITLQHKGMNSAGFQILLCKVRTAYGRLPVCMLLDKGSLHRAKASLRLAAKLNIQLIWLPSQCPELNCVDQLWRSVKADISANRQFTTVVQHARVAEDYLHQLTKKEVLTKAGILAKDFWLKGKL
jgi:transposase